MLHDKPSPAICEVIQFPLHRRAKPVRTAVPPIPECDPQRFGEIIDNLTIAFHRAFGDAGARLPDRLKPAFESPLVAAAQATDSPCIVARLMGAPIAGLAERLPSPDFVGVRPVPPRPPKPPRKPNLPNDMMAA